MRFGMGVDILSRMQHQFVLEALPDFDFLSAEYRAFFDLHGTTAFQAPLWQQRLHGRLGPALGAKSKTVVVRHASDGRLMAVLPMATQRAFGVTIAQFADFGTCDYNSAVADRETLRALAADPHFRAALRRAFEGSDLILFRKIRSDDFDMALLFGTSRTSVGEHPAYLCDVGTDFGHWRSKVLRNKFTKELGRLQRQTEREHGSFEHRLAVGEDEIDAAFEFLRQTQAERQRDSVLNKPEYYSFYRDFAIDGAASGAALTYVSYLAGKPVAVLFGPADRDRFHAVLIGVDTVNHARISPGTQLIYRVVEQRMRQGHSSFDMGLGDPGYKSHFRPTEIPMQNVSSNLTTRGMAVSFVYHYSKPLKNVLREFAPAVR